MKHATCFAFALVISACLAGGAAAQEATATTPVPDNSQKKFARDLSQADEYLAVLKKFKNNGSFAIPDTKQLRAAMVKDLSKGLAEAKDRGDTAGENQIEGQICRVNGDYGCAIKAFSAVISATSSKSYKAYVSADRGLVYFYKGDKAAALKDFEYVRDLEEKDKPYAAVELGAKLEKFRDAKVLFDDWMAYKRSKTPYYVAMTPECDMFEKAGMPVAGCFNRELFACFNDDKADRSGAGCEAYRGEVEYLKSVHFCGDCSKKKQ